MAVEVVSNFSNLFVDLLPLRSEMFKGGMQNFACQLLCHVFSNDSIFT